MSATANAGIFSGASADQCVGIFAELNTHPEAVQDPEETTRRIKRSCSGVRLSSIKSVLDGIWEVSSDSKVVQLHSEWPVKKFVAHAFEREYITEGGFRNRLVLLIYSSPDEDQKIKRIQALLLYPDVDFDARGEKFNFSRIDYSEKSLRNLEHYIQRRLGDISSQDVSSQARQIDHLMSEMGVNFPVDKGKIEGIDCGASDGERRLIYIHSYSKEDVLFLAQTKFGSTSVHMRWRLSCQGKNPTVSITQT